MEQRSQKLNSNTRSTIKEKKIFVSPVKRHHLSLEVRCCSHGLPPVEASRPGPSTESSSWDPLLCCPQSLTCVGQLLLLWWKRPDFYVGWKSRLDSTTKILQFYEIYLCLSFAPINSEICFGQISFWYFTRPDSKFQVTRWCPTGPNSLRCTVWPVRCFKIFQPIFRTGKFCIQIWVAGFSRKYCFCPGQVATWLECRPTMPGLQVQSLVRSRIRINEWMHK